MRKLAIGLLCSAFLSACPSSLLAEPVPAQPIELKNLNSGKQKFDPAMGYIFSQGPDRHVALLLRVPDADDIKAYEADWQVAFDKARARYQKRLANWESQAKEARSAKTTVPEKPVEPTQENFSIGAIELLGNVTFGPMFAFNKEEGNFSYLTKVKPGKYLYYGPITADPNAGMVGYCYCMGTVQFDVKPGVITNLGNLVDQLAPNAGKEIVLSPASPLPNVLQKYPSEPVVIEASGKVDNFYGVAISRVSPISGVLAYDRDKIIDLKAQAK